jgi:hypothetical protein
MGIDMSGTTAKLTADWTSAPEAKLAKPAASSSPMVPPNLGPEGMIAWLTTQMRRSNADVQITLKEVEGSRGKLDALRKLQVSLREHKSHVGSEGFVDMSDGHLVEWSKLKTADGKVDMEALKKEDWYQALSPEGKKAAEQFILQGTDGSVTKDECDNFMERVKDDIAGINSENEILMIGLQHTMQTRNQAIQLASNIISVLDRAAETPINNIK